MRSTVIKEERITFFLYISGEMAFVGERNNPELVYKIPYTIPTIQPIARAQIMDDSIIVS